MNWEPALRRGDEDCGASLSILLNCPLLSSSVSLHDFCPLCFLFKSFYPSQSWKWMRSHQNTMWLFLGLVGSDIPLNCIWSNYDDAQDWQNVFFLGTSYLAANLFDTRWQAHSVLSVKGKKVLHIDRNDHYGGYVVPTFEYNVLHLTMTSESASLNIENVSVDSTIHTSFAHIMASFLDDMATIQKARNRGRNMVESTTGMWTLCPNS